MPHLLLYSHRRENMVQMWHLPRLLQVCSRVNNVCIIFALCKFGENPIFRAVLFLAFCLLWRIVPYSILYLVKSRRKLGHCCKSFPSSMQWLYVSVINLMYPFFSKRLKLDFQEGLYPVSSIPLLYNVVAEWSVLIYGIYKYTDYSKHPHWNLTFSKWV